jgi:methionyl-tRNA formyltransferase
LNTPRKLCLNRHTSKLPAYRGIEPVFHALLRGEEEIGISFHEMLESVDSGKVYAQGTIPVSNSVYDCYERSFKASPQIFKEAVQNIVTNQPLFSVDDGSSVFYKWPTSEEIRKFKKLGYTYI